MAADKPASDDSVIDDALLDEDSMLGDEDSSGADSSLEDGSIPVDLTSSTLLPVIKGSPEKKQEAVKRSACISPIKVAGQTNGSAATVTGSPPAKKKITINRQPLPPAAAPVVTSPGDVSTEGKEGEKQVIKISAVATAEDKAKLRQDKFGAANSTDTPASKTAPSSVTSNPFLDERLKKRAERFGAGTGTATAAPTVTGKVSLTTEDDVKLAKRRERFGAGLTKPVEERKEQRAARFGAESTGTTGSTTITAITVSSDISPITVAAVGDSDDKKKVRAARFGAAP